MTNPLTIPILDYLKKQSGACSLIDLVHFCEQDFLSLIEKGEDAQIVIFKKNFFVMNALYQIQQNIQTEGYSLTIFPLEIGLVANNTETQNTLTTRDIDLAGYYLDWSNLTDTTAEEVDALFTSFWRKYSAVDNTDAALATLGLEQGVSWLEIRRAYKSKIAINHPDKGGDADNFIEIRKAYEVLNCSYHRP
jgi:hypothetical protein